MSTSGISSGISSGQPMDASSMRLLQSGNTKVSDEALKRAGTDPKKLREAAKEFESVYTDLVMKSMRDTIPDSDETGDSQKVKFFQTMLDTEYSKVISQKKGLGLADSIVHQFTKHQGARIETLGMPALIQSGSKESSK